MVLVCFLYLPLTAQKMGCLEGNCRNGISIWQWKSGAKYIGNFEDGKREGYGYFEFKNGDKYIGNWKNNRREGYGVYFYDSKGAFKKYAGEWKGDERIGIGIMVYTDGESQFGVWKENKYQYKYDSTGCINGDCQDGIGVYVWENGSRYEGEYQDGQRHGKGIYYYEKGGKYVGQFKYNRREGFGTYYYTTGNKFQGYWEAEVKHGEGRLYKNGKIVKEGTWQKGKFTTESLMAKKTRKRLEMPTGAEIETKTTSNEPPSSVNEKGGYKERPQIKLKFPTTNKYITQSDNLTIKLDFIGVEDREDIEVKVNSKVVNDFRLSQGGRFYLDTKLGEDINFVEIMITNDLGVYKEMLAIIKDNPKE